MSEDPAARAAGKADAVTDRDRPVTFRDVFAVREYRALYASLLVNWVGDYLAKAAVTVLVYQQSRSVLMSAAAFAVSFLPWIIGGTLLSAMAERYPYRRVLIIADLARMVPIALLLVPHMPIPIMLLLLFLASLGTPPTQAARSALQPLVISREKLATAITINQTTGQAAQVFGYLAGAALATAISPQVALAIDVLTFALSAAFIAAGVRPRPAARSRAQRTHLLSESAEGFRLVFGNHTLRSIAVVVFVTTMFAVVPEGLAAAWAAEGNPDSTTRGLNQGMIMAAGPVGYVIGGLLTARLLTPARRDRLVRPLAVLAALSLVPSVAGPPPTIVAILVMLSGASMGGLAPTLNGKFVLYGVMQTGIQLSQFAAVMITGVLADRFWLPLVVGLWSIGGTLVMLILVSQWPSDETFAAALDAAATDQPPADPTPEVGVESSAGPGARTAAQVAGTSVTPEPS